MEIPGIPMSKIYGRSVTFIAHHIPDLLEKNIEIHMTKL